MKYYVLRPDLTPYQGIKVTKKTHLNFENDKVKQTIKDLKLESEYVIQNAKFKSTNFLELNLEEGDILLLEEENRGYFLPQEPIGTIEEAITDYKALKSALKGDKNSDSKGNEGESI